MIKPLASLTVLTALSEPLLAVTVRDVPQLPAADRSAINALEQALFDGIEKDGVDVHMTAQFKAVGQEANITPALHETLKRLDNKCGKLVSVERYRSVAFGSRVVRDYFVTTFAGNSCVFRWKLTFAKVSTTWDFNRFDLKSLDGDDWPD